MGASCCTNQRVSHQGWTMTSKVARNANTGHTLCLRLWHGMQERTLLLRGSPLSFCDWVATGDMSLNFLPPTLRGTHLHPVFPGSGRKAVAVSNDGTGNPLSITKATAHCEWPIADSATHVQQRPWRLVCERRLRSLQQSIILSPH